MVARTLDEIVRTIIFVKVDNTLPTPDHPSIAAASAKIVEIIDDMLAEAYETGCTDTHANYQPDVCPEFGEAADDYANAAIHAAAF